MTHILQPLDFSCFRAMKKKYTCKFYGDMVAEWTPSKKRFFESYLHIRELLFSSKTIKKGFEKAGLSPLDRNVAKLAARKSLDKCLDETSSSKNSDSSSLKSNDIEDPIPEIDPRSTFNPNAPWSSFRVSLINAKVPGPVLEMIKAIIDFESEAVSNFKISEFQRNNLQKELIELKKSRFFKPKQISNQNRVTVQKFLLIQDDSNCSIRVNK